jgi:hypothetical protein
MKGQLELAHASQDVTFNNHALAENVEKFQANKITDVKVYDTIMELPSFAL